MTLDLTEQQQHALERVRQWHAGAQRRKPLFLGGYAGTGKTSIAHKFQDHLGTDEVIYAAFTGKAVSVLRQHGCEPASTLHSLLYHPKQRSREQLQTLQEKLDALGEGDAIERENLQRQIAAEERKVSSPDWELKLPEETPIPQAGLVVVDEVSMVSQRMGQQLASFNAPILCLGDPMQLPPVSGSAWMTSPDILLTEVHRSAWDSPVTRVATAVRQATPGMAHLGVDGVDAESGRIYQQLTPTQYCHFDQVLCGTNKTRWRIINLIRRHLNRRTGVPAPGDTIMVIANNAHLGVYNGQQFTVDSVRTQQDAYKMRCMDDEGGMRELSALPYGFVSQEGESKAKLAATGSQHHVAATFAQCITVHKAQGSQWPRVLVVDESRAMARMAPGHARFLRAQQWLYTAATRAQEQIVIV